MKFLQTVLLVAFCMSIADAQLSTIHQEITKIDARLKELASLWYIDVNIINGLTNYKRTPVQEGTQAYYQCCRASQRIQQVEAEAKLLKRRRAELALHAEKTPQQPRPSVASSHGSKTKSTEQTRAQESTKVTKLSPVTPKAVKTATDLAVKPTANALKEPLPTQHNTKSPDSISELAYIPTSPQSPLFRQQQRGQPISESAIIFMLNEARDALPSHAGELDFLEKRMDEIHSLLLTGMKQAVCGAHPLEDLQRSHGTITQISGVLSNPEKYLFVL
jgi:hypothetical protein